MKDGGPAFGSVSEGTDDMTGMPFRDHIPGMSLRDYMAAAALTGIITSTYEIAFDGASIQRTPENESKVAYAYADAMLLAREAK